MRTRRYGGAEHDVFQTARLAAGWSIEQAIPPSALVGANGLAFDKSGELHVAQLFGSEISAFRLDDGAVRVVSRTDDPITTPDDLAFDENGRMFVTEFTIGRVSARDPGGRIRVIDDAVPAANGICTLANRLFVGEFREHGRIFELFPDGRPRRVVVEQAPWPNGMAATADYLYYPCVLPGEIWRVPLAGGPPERLLAGLDLPNAVKADGEGSLVVALLGGDVLSIDIRSRVTRRIARLPPGNDNLALSSDQRLFVSNLVDGRITEVTGGAVREAVAPGFIGPFGLACGADGSLLIADAWSYAVRAPDGTVTRPAFMLTPGFPGMVRAVDVAPDGTAVFGTTGGRIAAYRPGADAKTLVDGLEGISDIALDPVGGVVATEAGTGRLVAGSPSGTVRTLASRLRRPMGVAVASDGSCFVAEARGGRVSHVQDGVVTPVIEGLIEPHGVALSGDALYVLDRGAKCLHRVMVNGSGSSVIARELPVGHARGVRENVAAGLPMAPGPWFPFAGVATASDGSVFVSADGDGSVLKLTQNGANTLRTNTTEEDGHDDT